MGEMKNWKQLITFFCFLIQILLNEVYASLPDVGNRDGM